MWGFNVTGETNTPTIEGDNRPCTPLMNRTFEQWWFHGLLDYPPHADDILQMPVGEPTMLQTVCDQWVLDYDEDTDGGRSRNWPCRKSLLDPRPAVPSCFFI